MEIFASEFRKSEHFNTKANKTPLPASRDFVKGSKYH